MKYELIQEGDKVKYIYLTEPNTIREDCIAFSGKFPTELNLARYVDHELMFKKAFLEPIKNIMSSLNWTTESENTLEGLFT